MVLPVLSCASQDLGHGYRLVQRQQDTSSDPNGFEAVAHYADLYYGLRKLGTPGQFSISPSGRYAGFEEEGRLLLFDRQSRAITDVTDGAFAIPRTFDWNEPAAFLEIDYYEDHAPSSIELPR
jgi:hypothetical protein